jgi:hypothetical protein
LICISNSVKPNGHQFWQIQRRLFKTVVAATLSIQRQNLSTV